MSEIILTFNKKTVNINEKTDEIIEILKKLVNFIKKEDKLIILGDTTIQRFDDIIELCNSDITEDCYYIDEDDVLRKIAKLIVYKVLEPI